MLNAENLKKDVEQWLQELNYKRQPQELYTPIEYSLSLGGKRIRPVLCLAACTLFSDDYERAKPAALALEIFHNFTLLHDDVMDHADIRRNKPTVCAKWNSNVAILSGDAMLIDAYQTISQVDSPAFSLILNTFTQTAKEVCEGQQYDMDFENTNDVTVEQYMEMIRLKTAVLIAASIKIGALIGGATDAETEILYNFGINMGLAFQLQDDLLDTYGNEATFGKAIGGDIVENKKTFLLISALENASAPQKRELLKWLDAVSPNREQKIAAVRSIYDQIGVKGLTEKKIAELQKEAMDSLREMDISVEGKRFLADFANSIFKRTR
ncbi:MAG: polyprenyl synthetase family protein [Bacteroidales bacterium]|jgi:geranylgeranyl diphosphate synthase type II|nr:polyprenyl synthetase family protein [Bacteroidales bacterium]MBR6249859.1 polyprenyl synthetase family protein [Bacteroidales bacterium]